MRKKLSSLDIVEIYNTLKNLKSINKVAKKLGFGKTTVSRVLNKYYPNFREHIEPQYHHSYKEIFPDNECILGYICGFIATDGCLNKGNKVISFANKPEDFSTIEWIGNTLVTPKPNFYISRTMFGFRATLPKLYQFCLDMGITPAKSLTLDVNLDNKSEEFKRYFLRGVIDGDGSVIFCSKTPSKSIIKIASASKKFIDLLEGIIPIKYPLRHIEFTRGKSILIDGRITKKRRMYKVQVSRLSEVKELASYLPIEDYMITRKNQKLASIRAIEVNNSHKNHFSTKYKNIKYCRKSNKWRIVGIPKNMLPKINMFHTKAEAEDILRYIIR